MPFTASPPRNHNVLLLLLWAPVPPFPRPCQVESLRSLAAALPRLTGLLLRAEVVVQQGLGALGRMQGLRRLALARVRVIVTAGDVDGDVDGGGAGGANRGGLAALAALQRLERLSIDRLAVVGGTCSVAAALREGLRAFPRSQALVVSAPAELSEGDAAELRRSLEAGGWHVALAPHGGDDRGGM